MSTAKRDRNDDSDESGELSDSGRLKKMPSRDQLSEWLVRKHCGVPVNSLDDRSYLGTKLVHHGMENIRCKEEAVVISRN